MVDTATDDVERSGNSVVSLLLEDLDNLVIRHTGLDILTIRADEDVYERSAIRNLGISLSERTDIVTSTLLESLTCLLDGSHEIRVVLALACQGLNYVLHLDLEHNVHTALQVKAEVHLLLLALLVGKLGDTHVVNHLVCDRVEIILLHRETLLLRERLRILYGSLLYAGSLPRKRELVDTSQSQEDGE